MTRTKSYFVSDFHLGAPDWEISLEREKRIVRWLDSIKDDVRAIYFLGDIFDFWYEWNNVVPKGFYRFLAKLAELRELGVEMFYFTGNHDVWQYNYLKKELGIHVYQEPRLMDVGGHKIYMGHGDGIGSKSFGYWIIKTVFTNKICQWLYSNVFHPNFAMWIGHKWSAARHQYTREIFPFQNEGEYIIKYIRSVMDKEKADCYIFGHRHIDSVYDLGGGIQYINTGVWFRKSPYAVLEDGKVSLRYFEE